MKKKILTIAIFSVMVLTVIGLAVGLVLVAGRASMNNVMQISYVSNNVGARITAYGILYPNATGTENGVTIPTADGNDSETVEFYEDQEDANGNISFQTVDVTATSRAVYTFNITNTVSSTNTKELKALFAFNNLNDSDNVIIQVGTSESNAIYTTHNRFGLSTSKTANSDAYNDYSKYTVYTFTNRKTGTYTIDISSLTGTYYPRIFLISQSADAYITISELYFK